MEDDQYKVLRKQFFKGEIGVSGKTTTEDRQTRHRPFHSSIRVSDNPLNMLKRVPDRLRSVLIRACHGSKTSAVVVDAFERHLMDCFHKGKKSSSLDLSVVTTLQEQPAVSRATPTNGTVVQYRFSPKTETAGFHRLLLHAVCKFHSLTAVSATITVEPHQCPSRVLTVSGVPVGSHVRVLDTI